jgi:hypothetical protein
MVLSGHHFCMVLSGHHFCMVLSGHHFSCSLSIRNQVPVLWLGVPVVRNRLHV